MWNDKWARAVVLSGVLVADAAAANGSNFLQLMNGMDAFFGGFLNPTNPPSNVTNGVWRCIPSQILHAPTRVSDPTDPLYGQYATKIDALHLTSCASTGAVATWPTIALSSGDSDCRVVVQGSLNFGFASAAAFGGSGLGWFAIGPTSGTTPPSLLLLIFNTSFPGPHFAGPTGAIVYGVELEIAQQVGTVSAITIPENQSLTYWIADDKAESPGAYQYFVGSTDERGLCSSLSFFASGVRAVGTAVSAWVVSRPRTEEWGMFISTVDGTLMAATAPTIMNPGSDTTMGTANPMDTGIGGLAVSLTGSTVEGGNGLGGHEILSFNGYDQNNAFGGAPRLLIANLAAFNSLGAPSCGAWSPGYVPTAFGGFGGPALSTAIPQQPRIVGKLDPLAITLLTNPLWLTLTTHSMVAAGNQYPMFPGYPSQIGGSTGNTGGAGIPLPILPALVGAELCFSGVSLNAAGTSIAPIANSGHSHTHGWTTRFFP